MKDHNPNPSRSSVKANRTLGGQKVLDQGPTSPAGKPRLALIWIGLLLLGGVATVQAQFALDGFDPNANGIIRAIVVQPDGKILIGGEFTALAPNGGGSIPCNRIARLNPDGSVDTTFNPNANGTVHAIAVQVDGRVIAGGNFTTIGGQTRNNIVRLDATTGLADSIDPNANGTVYSIAVQTDGQILAGGNFTSIGGQPRNYIARLDATSGLADSFNPSANNQVRSIALQADGKILVGGFFSQAFGVPSIGGTGAQLLWPVSMPPLAWRISFDPNVSEENEGVLSIALQADGKVLAGGGGDFGARIGGQMAQ